MIRPAAPGGTAAYRAAFGFYEHYGVREAAVGGGATRRGGPTPIFTGDRSTYPTSAAHPDFALRSIAQPGLVVTPPPSLPANPRNELHCYSDR